MHKKLRVYIKPLRGILALTIVLGMLSAIATIFQMTLLSGVVNAVFLSHKGLMQVLLPLDLLPGVLILRASLLWGREVTTQRAAILLKASLRERVFAHLLRLGPTWSSGERTCELAAVVNEGIERLDASISRYLPQLVLSIVVPLLIIVVISLVDWFSAVLLLVTGPIIPLLMFLVGGYTEKRIQAQWATLSRMSAHFLDVMQGLTTLKLFGRSQAQQERIARISDRFRDKTLQVLRYAFLSGAVLEFMTMMAIGVIATTLGVRLLNHGITFGSAFLVLLPANTCTALVGRSGAGKSTLVNLLMRFMDATSGTISANGVSITALSPDAWRQYVALVPQRPYLFYGTVRDNIRLARPGANDSEVLQAATLAGVTVFIDELPHGFDTQVGEQGMRLSAGQAQRVAIARAILKNAPILILDEPTSSLDPHSEALIRQSLTTLMRDRTVLVIAHRYNTIAQADRVIVLEDGRVAGAGVSDALTQGNDVYACLLGALSTSEVSGGSIERHSAAALPRSAYAARQQNERQL